MNWIMYNIKYFNCFILRDYIDKLLSILIKFLLILFKGEFNKIFKIKILKYFFIHPYFSPISFPIFSLPCFVIVFSNFLDFYDLMLYLITISWHFCF